MIFQHGGPVLEGDNDSKEETTFYITLTIERDEDEASADEEDLVEGCDEYDVTSGSASDHRHRVQRRPDASSTGTFEIPFMHMCQNEDKDQVLTVVIC